MKFIQKQFIGITAQFVVIMAYLSFVQSDSLYDEQFVDSVIQVRQEEGSLTSNQISKHLRNLETTKCNSGEYLYQVTSTQSVCIKCQTGCTECCDTNLCIKCSSYYFLSSKDSTCIKCSSGCLKCTSESICLECERGTYLDTITKQCIKCPTGCTSCTSATSCQTCSSGYYQIAKNQICQACHEGCSICNNDAEGTCLKCLDYYRLDDTQCTGCPSNCIQCDSNNVCLLCDNGLVYQNGQCEPCDKNCAVCSKTTNFCEECKAGYLLDKISNECKKCNNSRCQTCDPLDSSKCLSCQSNYKLSKGNCINCNGVKGSSSYPYGSCTECGDGDNTCNLCNTGYFKDTISNFCSKCPSSCTTCISDQVCTSCKSGFFLQTNKCVPCPPNCLSCKSKTECSQCNDGMYFQGNRCGTCADKCQKCVGNVCVKCLPGYSLNGEQCILCTEDVCTCNLEQIYAQTYIYTASSISLLPFLSILILSVIVLF